jgi:hypothetical protein
MKFTSKTVRRKFEFDLRWLGPLAQAVVHVLDSLEKHTVEVYRPDDEEAFLTRLDDDGRLPLHARADLAVRIPEWICVACQRIRLQDEGDAARAAERPDALAWYYSNAQGLLFPADRLQEPVGPAGLDAEIVLTHKAVEYLTAGAAEEDPDKFQFIVAHELVHAFDAMRVIVPAVMDWKTYWEKALGSGSQCDAAREMASFHALFLDDYGGENELAMIEEYWPSQARRWFEAFRGPVTRRSRTAGRRKK